MFVKMCGFTRMEDVTVAARLGIGAVGFNFYKGSGRFIDAHKARPLIQALPPSVEAWGLFVNADAAEVQSVLKVVSLQILQFHGDEDLNFCRSFGLPFVKAFRIAKPQDMQAIDSWIPQIGRAHV